MENEFSKVLKHYRAINGMTQDDLIDKLADQGEEFIGITKGTISKWETGKAIPRKDKIEALEEIFDLDGQLLEAAGYPREAGFEESSKSKIGEIFLKQREEHFMQLVEMIKILLGDLDTVKPILHRKGTSESKYWIGLPGQEREIDNTELMDMIQQAHIATPEKVGSFLWDCLLSHLESESFSKMDESTYVDSYSIIERLRILTHRKTFKGTCPICASWP